uniref:Putative structural protein n=1 Tax=viral metagenome TaxID=1070528 RepID=A0A6M3IXM4_9ZZZZ
MKHYIGDTIPIRIDVRADDDVSLTKASASLTRGEELPLPLGECSIREGSASIQIPSSLTSMVGTYTVWFDLGFEDGSAITHKTNIEVLDRKPEPLLSETREELIEWKEWPIPPHEISTARQAEQARDDLRLLAALWTKLKSGKEVKADGKTPATLSQTLYSAVNVVKSLLKYDEDFTVRPANWKSSSQELLKQVLAKLRSAGIQINVEESFAASRVKARLVPFVVVDQAVCIVGSSLLPHLSEPPDIDVLIRWQDDVIPAVLEAELLRVLGQEPHLILQSAGPHSTYMPLYDFQFVPHDWNLEDFLSNPYPPSLSVKELPRPAVLTDNLLSYKVEDHKLIFYCSSSGIPKMSLALKLRKLFIEVDIEWADEADNTFTPVGSLVLVPRIDNDLKLVNEPYYEPFMAWKRLELNEAVDPSSKITPQKPRMKLATDYWSADELWDEWAEDNLEHGIVVSVKWDGFRVLLSNDKKVKLFFADTGDDRAEQPFFKELTSKLAKLPSFVLDGEFLAEQSGTLLPRTQLFTAISGGIEATPKIAVFDLLFWDGEDYSEKPYKERLEKLASVSSQLPKELFEVEHRQITSKEDLEKDSKWAASQEGSEGIVACLLDAPYKQGGTDALAKVHIVFELKAKILGVSKVANGHVYQIGLSDPPDNYPDSKIARVGNKDYADLGNTFVSNEKMGDTGDTLNVRVEELILLSTGVLSTGKPTPVGPDKSRGPYSFNQTIELAKRAHVLKEEKPEEEALEEADSFKVPDSVAKSAAKGLEWRREFNRGGTEVGVARARDLSNGGPVSLDTIGRMVSYFARHEVDKKGKDFNNNENPSAGRIAWELWGGDAGKEWSERIWNGQEKKEEVQEAKLPPDEFEGVEGGTRSEKSWSFWENNWHKRLGPVQGSRPFICHLHFRGLNEEESKLSLDQLMQTNNSVHGDLRFSISPGLAWWGMTLFIGRAPDNYPRQKLEQLDQVDLQVWPKYVTPIPGVGKWISLAKDAPIVHAPGEVGATENAYAKFFAWDSGRYELGVANRSFIEVFIHGQHLKGRYTFQKAEAEGRRWWILSKPEDQKRYSEAHELDDTLKRLKGRGHKYLIWDGKTYDVKTGEEVSVES